MADDSENTSNLSDSATFNYTTDTIDLTDSDEGDCVISVSASLSPSNNTLFSQSHIEQNNKIGADDSLEIVYQKLCPPPEIEIIDRSNQTLAPNCRKSSTSRRLPPRRKHAEIRMTERHENIAQCPEIIAVNRICPEFTPVNNIYPETRSKIPACCDGKVGKSASPNEDGTSKKCSCEHLCSICLDKFPQITSEKRALVVTVCGHVFCQECLQKSMDLSKQCPVCRKRLGKKQFHPLFI